MNKPKIDKKTLKYGSAAVILTVVFIALIFVLNLVVTSLTDKYNLVVDLTEEQLYEISPASKELLGDLGEDKIDIIFFTPLDEFDNNEYAKSVKTLALEYEENYKNIEIKYINMIENPNLVMKYNAGMSGSDKLNANTVIVECGDRFTYFDLGECFVYTQDENGNYSYYAFNAEYRFTSSIMRVTKLDKPKVVFTTNHLETVPVQFSDLFEEAGFEVIKLDVSQNDIPADAEVVIINDPQADFAGIESESVGNSEITKLSRYLENGGNVMLFVGPATPELKNLDELTASWGIEIGHGYTVVDDKNSIPSTGSLALIANYVEGDEVLSPFHSVLSSKENPLKTVSYNTVPLNIVPVTDTKQRVGAIITASDTAYVPANGKQLSAANMPLMAASYKEIWDKERQETMRNFFVVGGSTWFTGDGSMSSPYGNAELLKSTIQNMTDEAMILSVSYKVYNDTALTVDTATSQNWLMIFVLTLPALVLLVAFVVFLRRRHL